MGTIVRNVIAILFEMVFGISVISGEFVLYRDGFFGEISAFRFIGYRMFEKSGVFTL